MLSETKFGINSMNSKLRRARPIISDLSDLKLPSSVFTPMWMLLHINSTTQQGSSEIISEENLVNSNKGDKTAPTLRDSVETLEMHLPNITYPRQDRHTFKKKFVTDSSPKSDISEAIPLNTVNISESNLPIMVTKWSKIEINLFHTVTIPANMDMLYLFITR